jgi:hypothetical protein
MTFLDCEVRMRMCMHPSFLGNPEIALTRQLDCLLRQYQPTLNGVPVAHRQGRFVTPRGLTIADEAMTQWEIAAILTVFAPRPGSQMIGEVQLCLEDQVSITYGGLFKGVIKRAGLGEGLGFRVGADGEGRWENGMGVVIKKGSSIRFEVTEVEVGGSGIINMVSTLVSVE